MGTYHTSQSNMAGLIHAPPNAKLERGSASPCVLLSLMRCGNQADTEYAMFYGEGL